MSHSGSHGRRQPPPGSARCRAPTRPRPSRWSSASCRTFLYLPELPARGRGGRPDRPDRRAARRPAGGDDAGRLEAGRPAGPRPAARAGLLSADLDALQEAAADWAGPFKIQVCGPWTLAATIELTRSQNPALADPGAVADLIASLAEGVAAHVAEVRGRLPGATLLLQLDEPALPAVLAGSVPTASGLNRVGAVDTP